MFGRLLVFIFIGLIAFVWIFIQVSRIFFAYTGDAYVLTDYVVLSPTVSGRLARIDVGDNEVVTAGAPLFQIDERPYALAVAAAEATATLAEAAQKSAHDGLAEAQAEVSAAQAALNDVKLTQERLQSLLARGTVTQQSVDDATRNFEAATASLASAQAGVAVAVDLVAQRTSALAAAQAALGVAQYNLGQTTVVSPYDGFVAPFTTRAGTYLEVGDQVMAVVDDDAWRIVANLPEEHLAYVAVGQKVWFMVSSRPWRIYRGTVSSISRGISRTPTAVEPLPFVEPATDWIRLSRRFPVEIAIDKDVRLPFYLGADARVLIWHPNGEAAAPTEPALAAPAPAAPVPAPAAAPAK